MRPIPQTEASPGLLLIADPSLAPTVLEQVAPTLAKGGVSLYSGIDEPGAARPSVRRLVLYHHAPAHGDDLMDEIARIYAARGNEVGLEVVTAHEHMTLGIGVEGGA